MGLVIANMCQCSKEHTPLEIKIRCYTCGGYVTIEAIKKYAKAKV